MIFFFQAEDGIRDADVTGVQTCALPICFFLFRAARTTSVAIAKAEAGDDQSTDAQETLGFRNETMGSLEEQGCKAIPSLAGFRQRHGRRGRRRGKSGHRQRAYFDALRSKVLFVE